MELGCKQGRSLEPVDQEFRVGELGTPADQTLLSVREGGTLQPGEGPQFPPQPQSKASASPKPPGCGEERDCTYPDQPSIPSLERPGKLGAAHLARGRGTAGGRGWRRSEDLVEPAGHGLAGGASLRARLLMSPVCPVGFRDQAGFIGLSLAWAVWEPGGRAYETTGRQPELGRVSWTGVCEEGAPCPVVLRRRGALSAQFGSHQPGVTAPPKPCTFTPSQS